MRKLYGANLSRGDCIRVRGLQQSRQRESIMIPEPATPGTDTGVLAHFGQVGNSRTTTPDNAALFAYISIPSVMSSRQDSVYSSESERSFSFDVYS